MLVIDLMLRLTEAASVMPDCQSYNVGARLQHMLVQSVAMAVGVLSALCEQVYVPCGTTTKVARHCISSRSL